MDEPGRTRRHGQFIFGACPSSCLLAHAHCGGRAPCSMSRCAVASSRNQRSMNGFSPCLHDDLSNCASTTTTTTNFIAMLLRPTHLLCGGFPFGLFPTAWSATSRQRKHNECNDFCRALAATFSRGIVQGNDQRTGSHRMVVLHHKPAGDKRTGRTVQGGTD